MGFLRDYFPVLFWLVKGYWFYKQNNDRYIHIYLCTLCLKKIHQQGILGKSNHAYLLYIQGSMIKTKYTYITYIYSAKYSIRKDEYL